VRMSQRQSYLFGRWSSVAKQNLNGRHGERIAVQALRRGKATRRL
jgi:hypothetical protein